MERDTSQRDRSQQARDAHSKYKINYMKEVITMTNNELTAKIAELKELEAMQDELKTMIESIKDELKAELTEQGVEELEVGANIVRYTTVLSQRFDSTALKKKLPEIYGAYTKQVTSKRFTIS